MTAEIKKGQYVYYRCTQSRGKCDLSYIREEELGDRLGTILKDIHIPDDILAQLREAVLSERGRQDKISSQQTSLLQQRLAQVNRRMDQAYVDKLDGRISDEFWARKSAEWQAEEQRILASIQSLQTATPERSLDGARILELASKAYFLYLRQPPVEKAKLLKMVLLELRNRRCKSLSDLQKAIRPYLPEDENRGLAPRAGLELATLRLTGSISNS